ncbi:DMT family transporter [Viridibacterium curvum]|uniref:DMT family transporter n=1 Tax=Viridibacterium curvum TaxID=1101404 RepID=A0ABP9R2Q2_9RHOO
MLIYALALLFFAGMDAISKFLAVRHPVPFVAWMRYLVQLLLMTAIFAPVMGRELVILQRPGLVVLRGLCLVGITLFMMFGLQRLPLAEATSIVFIAPLLVVVGAKPILGERIGKARWLAVSGGFAGVLLIIRPGSSLDQLGVVFAMLTASCMTAYQLLTRVLTRSENSVAMLYYSGVVGTMLFTLSLPWYWATYMPPWQEMVLLCSFGTLGFLGHLCFTLAFRDTQASTLAPLTYVQLLWAGLLGWLVFGQRPDSIALCGMAIVGACGVIVALTQPSVGRG